MARMLVVDDDVGVRSLIKKYLTAEGHEVLEAGDGRAALEALELQSVDLIITDVYMPDTDGVELTVQLKHLRRNPVQIIAISGGGRQDSVDLLDMTRRLGATTVLRKPFTRDELMAVVNRSLVPISGGV